MPSLNLQFNIPYELTPADRESIRSVCPDADLRAGPQTCHEQSDELDGGDVDVLVTEFVPRNLDVWPKLKLVQLVSAGIDHLNGHPIWERDIPVATASGIHTVPMGQFATAAYLSLVHRFRHICEYSQSRAWRTRDDFSGSIVRSRTVGILGYGNIGRECARQLHALGMRVVCASRGGRPASEGRFLAWPGTGDPEGRIPEKWFTPDQIAPMLPLCDLLLVTAPRTASSRGMIGSKQLALLPRQSIVIVISRGGIVDEEALAAALHSGHLAAAWIDTFATEPPPAEHPLFTAPNVVLTPHMSGAFSEYWLLILQLLRENLKRLQAGQPLLNVAHETLGY